MKTVEKWKQQVVHGEESHNFFQTFFFFLTIQRLSQSWRLFLHDLAVRWELLSDVVVLHSCLENAYIACANRQGLSTHLTLPGMDNNQREGTRERTCAVA